MIGWMDHVSSLELTIRCQFELIVLYAFSYGE